MARLARWTSLSVEEQMNIFRDAGVADSVIVKKDLPIASQHILDAGREEPMPGNQTLLIGLEATAKYAQYVKDIKAGRRRLPPPIKEKEIRVIYARVDCVTLNEKNMYTTANLYRKSTRFGRGGPTTAEITACKGSAVGGNFLSHVMLPCDLRCLSPHCDAIVVKKGSRIKSIDETARALISGFDAKDDGEAYIQVMLAAACANHDACQLAGGAQLMNYVEFVKTELGWQGDTPLCPLCLKTIRTGAGIPCRDACGHFTYCSIACATEHQPFHDEATHVQARITDATRICARCGASGVKLPKCARCKQVYYCDATCQRDDWERHRANCH